ncbi:hypothetical protein RHGRI_029246 [Rhododendron griersonianum]|uniref:Uncharacterized protein n=1 Tax=Rhododendron griersonianum TaxID=479676 RepID=A0AAV6IIP0_9ERIC|nr:hypothetical protein RHGRI_029246 [Rhododendron griersonianum]
MPYLHRHRFNSDDPSSLSSTANQPFSPLRRACYRVGLSVIQIPEGFPEDPSGRFDDFDHFVKSNFDICKWIGWLLVLAQVWEAALQAGKDEEAIKLRQCEDLNNLEHYLPPEMLERLFAVSIKLLTENANLIKVSKFDATKFGSNRRRIRRVRASFLFQALACPMAPEYLEFVQEQVNTTQGFTRHNNDSYSTPYNLGWGHHPTLSWTQQAPPTNPHSYNPEFANKMLQALQRLEASTRLLNSHTPSINKLETHMSQLGDTINTSEEGNFSSQPEKQKSVDDNGDMGELMANPMGLEIEVLASKTGLLPFAYACAEDCSCLWSSILAIGDRAGSGSFFSNDILNSYFAADKPWWSTRDKIDPFNSGVLYIKREVGSCSYVDDPVGCQSLLSRAMHKVLFYLCDHQLNISEAFVDYVVELRVLSSGFWFDKSESLYSKYCVGAGAVTIDQLVSTFSSDPTLLLLHNSFSNLNVSALFIDNYLIVAIIVESICLSNQIAERELLLESEEGRISTLCSNPESENNQNSTGISFVASGEAQIVGEKDESKYAPLSSYCDDKGAYSSMCPTGHFSFKLYDWNPAEFPRRLWYERLPRALHQHFPTDRSSTWVLLRYGSKAWPVETVNHEFHKGWDDFRKANELEVNHKLTLACERKWIFHTIMFDRRGWELYLEFFSSGFKRKEGSECIIRRMKVSCLQGDLSLDAAVKVPEKPSFFFAAFRQESEE